MTSGDIQTDTEIAK